ncbi:hypothetical protein D3C85_1800400 [compost metagenome]
MLEGVGRRRRPQAVHAQPSDLDAGGLGVLAHQGIDAVGGDAGAGLPTAQRHKQRRFVVVQLMP